MQRPRRIRIRDKEVAETNRPSVVSHGAVGIQRHIREANAVLIASPEYN